MIDGIQTKQLKVFSDERGRLMEMLRHDDDVFVKFGQTYMTVAYPGVVKAWHYHKKQYDNFAVVRGMIKLVAYDSREDSPTLGEVNEFFIGDHNPLLVQIPPFVMHGLKCISEESCIVINAPTEVYDPASPDEFRVDPHDNDIPYDWARKDA